MQTLQIGDTWLEEDHGGLARYYFELLRSLPAAAVGVRGMVVGSDLAARSTGGQVQAFARPDDPLLTRMRACRRVALDIMRHNKVDLLVSHFAIYAFPLVDQVNRTPSVMHFHGPWAGESQAEAKFKPAAFVKGGMERVVYSRATRLIVLSQSFRDELIRRYGVDGDRVRIVPGAVDLNRFNVSLSRAEARRQLNWPADRPILLTVRRLARRMGLENLVEAITAIRERVPDVLLMLGGTGALAGELKDLVAERGLEKNVQLLGRVPDDDLPLAYRAADLSVVPTIALEGFGLITLESLASGTPVYVTPIGGLPEVVLPFAPECVFEGASLHQIARVLTDALTGAVPRPADAACRAYAEKFSWSNIAEQVRNVYAEAVQ